MAHRKLVVTPRPRPQRRLGCSATRGLLCRGCASRQLGVAGRGSRRPRLGLACYPNQVSRRERLPVPPARISRAAAPASEHTCGPAPAPFVSRFLKSIRGTASVSRWQSAGAGSCALSGIARAGARGGEAPRTIPAGPRCWGRPGKRAGSASPNHPGNPGWGGGGQSGSGGER